MNEDKRFHLQFIQDVITRMNSNSTSMKNWMIAIVSALLALYANSSNITYIWVALAPVGLFWLFDTYYLKMERQYRKLYEKVVADDQSVKPFCMDAHKEKVNYFLTLLRPIEGGFYIPVIVGLVIAAIMLGRCC